MPTASPDPPFMRSLGTAEGSTIVEHVVAAAEAQSMAVTVAVADAAGGLVLLHRMDGCARLATITVQRKIATVVLTGRSTLETAEAFAGDSTGEPGLLPAMIAGAGVFTVPGGVPVVHGGEIVGVVAVSGSSSADDHDLALAATAALRA